MKNNYLVTGGLGFIGSHLVESLLQYDPDARIWIVDDGENASWNPMKGRLDDGKIRNLLIPLMGGYEVNSDPLDPIVIIIAGDCAHSMILDRIRAGHFCCVFHLAADVSVVKSIERPITTLEQNVKKSLLLAKACAEGETKLIFSSSAAVYGDFAGKMKECYQFVPTNPYGLSKATVESWLKVYENLYGLDWVSLRYFNVYGPRQTGGSPYGGVVANWIHNLYWQKPIIIYGDGEQVRDFVFVKDVARANICAINMKKTISRTYNICTGIGVSLNQLLVYLSEDRKDILVKRKPARQSDIRVSLGDPFLAYEFLDWKTEYNIEEGLKATKEWRGL